MKRPTKHARRCSACGQRIGLSLTPEDVAAIRQLLKMGKKQVSIARAFDVTETMISRIKYGRNWKPLDGD